MLVMLVISCAHKKLVSSNVIVPAYYFWRTGSSMDGDERDLLRRHQIHTLYTKILDIDWGGENGAIPVASLDIHDFNRQLNVYDSLGVRIVPVIFITNKTFVNIDSVDIPALAKRVLRRCLPAYDSMDREYEARDYLNDRSLARPCEVQFDCDWTAGTAGKYFLFLKTVRQLLPADSIHISATIRLHQYKYPGKTGVPPVDRGMLMLYNVSDLTQYSPVNSIFDEEKAQAYFTGNRSYPLPLDMALPAYSWGLVFRGKKFYQIENGLDAAAMAGNDAVESEGAAEQEGAVGQKGAVRQEGKGHPMKEPAAGGGGNPVGNKKYESNGVSFYRVRKDTVIGELFLRPNDEIKIESIDSSLLWAAARLSRRALNTDTFRVALFELSSDEIKHYSNETLAQIYSSYR
jgi:hypothetical protein